MRYLFRAALAGAFVLACEFTATAAPLPASAFAYDDTARLNVTVVGQRHADAIIIRDIRFPSPKGGMVNAQLILPSAKVRGGGVLFVHWLGDPKTTNLTEFRRDAETVARHGGVALLVNAMWSLPAWYEKGRTPEDDFTNSIKQVIDLRRALDVLVRQPGVRSDRIAYVGHDFGAMYGAMLSGVDPRTRWYVLMAGNPSFAKWYTYEAKPKDAAAYSAQMAQLEPMNYLARSQAREFLFQFAGKDPYVSADEARAFTATTPLPFGIFTYKAGHSLAVPEAFSDRITWILDKLGL